MHRALEERIKRRLPADKLHLRLLTASPVQIADSYGPVRPIRKMPKSSNLSINLPALSKERTRSSGALRSPPISPPYVSPHSPGDMNGKSVGGAFDPPHSPITALPQPQPPQSPKFSERSKSIFSTKAFSKSQSRLAQETSHRANEPVPVYQHSKTPGSTPELGPPETSSTSDRELFRFISVCAPTRTPTTSWPDLSFRLLGTYDRLLFHVSNPANRRSNFEFVTSMLTSHHVFQQRHHAQNPANQMPL